MREHHGGTVINMSSIGGRIASPYVSAYYATKFAVEGLSESLRYELKSHRVRVKVIEPAHFKTGFIDRAQQQWATHPAYGASGEQHEGVGRSGGRAAAPVPEDA